MPDMNGSVAGGSAPVMRSEAGWSAIMADFKTSGMTRRSFCESRQLSLEHPCCPSSDIVEVFPGPGFSMHGPCSDHPQPGRSFRRANRSRCGQQREDVAMRCAAAGSRIQAGARSVHMRPSPGRALARTIRWRTLPPGPPSCACPAPRAADRSRSSAGCTMSPTRPPCRGDHADGAAHPSCRPAIPILILSRCLDTSFRIDAIFSMNRFRGRSGSGGAESPPLAGRKVHPIPSCSCTGIRSMQDGVHDTAGRMHEGDARALIRAPDRREGKNAPVPMTDIAMSGFFRNPRPSSMPGGSCSPAGEARVPMPAGFRTARRTGMQVRGSTT